MPILTISGQFIERSAFFVACCTSYVFDFVVRQKAGGINLNFFIVEQVPMVCPDGLEQTYSSVSDRAIELSFTTYDLEPFARSLGDIGQPFLWDEGRRFLIAAELDALFFRLYGIGRDDVNYIMETFPIVKRKDIVEYGSYRTKEIILEFYDRMASADAAGMPYETTISPPPGEGPRHPASTHSNGCYLGRME
jgi:hypothetical protein